MILFRSNARHGIRLMIATGFRWTAEVGMDSRGPRIVPHLPQGRTEHGGCAVRSGTAVRHVLAVSSTHMAADTERNDDLEWRRARMLEESQRARQRRRATTPQAGIDRSTHAD